MNFSKIINTCADKMYNSFAHDGGKVLVLMGSLGWLLGGLAQCGGILLNKNIDKNQKKFLLPQEAADGAVNTLLYYSVSQGIKSLGDFLVEKGSLLTDDVAKAITHIKPTGARATAYKNWKNIFSGAELQKNLTTLLSDAKNLSIIKNAPIQEQAQMIRAAEKALKTLEKHKNNVGIITSIGASIVASNILTPIARNYIGAYVQKKLQKKEAIETRKTQIKENITMKNPLPTSFKAFNNYNSFSGIKI